MNIKKKKAQKALRSDRLMKGVTEMSVSEFQELAKKFEKKLKKEKQKQYEKEIKKGKRERRPGGAGWEIWKLRQINYFTFYFILSVILSLMLLV